MLKDNAKLNLNALNQVSGGTIKELEGLIKAYGKDILEGFGPYSGISNTNIVKAEVMEGILDKMGISADISVGWRGTGFRQRKNTYFDNTANRNLTQTEVETRLANCNA